MKREDFFGKTQDSFLEQKTITLDDLAQVIETVVPIFGDLEIKEGRSEDGDNILQIIDEDEGDIIISTDDVAFEDVDMSVLIATLILSDDNLIEVVDCNVKNIITPSNKEQILFFASLVGKTVIL